MAARVVKDIEVEKCDSVADLATQLRGTGGFTAAHLSTALEILRRAIKDKDCLRILTFPACVVATGTRGVLRYLIEQKLFDVVITTCGTLDHDIARCFGHYYHGSFDADDAALAKKGIHRLGNIFIPERNYGQAIERVVSEFLKRERIDNLGSYEIVWRLGEWLSKKAGARARSSLVYWSAQNRVPFFIPALTDGAFGYQLWLRSQGSLAHNPFKDESALNDLIWNSRRRGALIIGGGVSKHHAIWWSQFKGGLDYAIYITTASESDGSLSGARTREALTWHKIAPHASHITINGDATILLPLLIAALRRTPTAALKRSLRPPHPQRSSQSCGEA